MEGWTRRVHFVREGGGGGGARLRGVPQRRALAREPPPRLALRLAEALRQVDRQQRLLGGPRRSLPRRARINPRLRERLAFRRRLAREQRVAVPPLQRAQLRAVLHRKPLAQPPRHCLVSRPRRRAAPAVCGAVFCIAPPGGGDVRRFEGARNARGLPVPLGGLKF